MKKKLIYIIIMSIIFGALYTTSVFALTDEQQKKILNPEHTTESQDISYASSLSFHDYNDAIALLKNQRDMIQLFINNYNQPTEPKYEIFGEEYSAGYLVNLYTNRLMHYGRVSVMDKLPSDISSLEALIKEYCGSNPNNYDGDDLSRFIAKLKDAYKSSWAEYSNSRLQDIYDENEYTAHYATEGTSAKIIAKLRQDVATSLKNEKATYKDDNLNYWDPSRESGYSSGVIDFAGTIVAIIRNVGIVVAVIALMVIGFREMTGSVEQKSVIKQALPGYLIGVVMVVAITLIPTIIYNVVRNW